MVIQLKLAVLNHYFNSWKNNSEIDERFEFFSVAAMNSLNNRFHSMQVIFFSYCMMVSLPLTSPQEATGSCWVESRVKIVPILTCAWLASQQKAPVKVRGTGVPSPGKEVPSPWQLHRAPATCLLGQPHMKREALCNPTGITPPNNAPLKERQKPCIKRCWGGARLWSPTTTNTDSSTTSHLRKRLSPFSICCLCPPSALSSLGSGLLSAHSFSFALQCGEGQRLSLIW